MKPMLRRHRTMSATERLRCLERHNGAQYLLAAAQDPCLGVG